MKHVKTYEGFISKVKSFIKNTIDDQNTVQKLPSVNEVRELINNSLMYLFDNGEFDIKITNDESNVNTSPKGEVLFTNSHKICHRASQPQSQVQTSTIQQLVLP